VLEVEFTAETATPPPQTPLQKHSIDGYTVDVLRSNCRHDLHVCRPCVRPSGSGPD